MNMMRRRNQAMLESVAEHRRREDAAPRLRDEVARLISLRLKFEAIPTEGRSQTMSYVRPIVVASAPAHFEIRCMEPRCDGRHDLTRPILQALRQAQAVFTGQSQCDGMVGELRCDRLLGYTLEAAYRP